MKKISIIALLMPIAARAAATCPTGYISVNMPDVEIASSCEAGYTSAGTIEDCSTGAGVCAILEKTCDAGYYLKDDECVWCKDGLSGTAGVYCPGDNMRHDCPTYQETVDAGADYEALIGFRLTGVVGAPWTHNNSTPLTGPGVCQIYIYFIDDERGKGFFHSSYNPDNRWYWKDTRYWRWEKAFTGYYLSDWVQQAFYNDIKQCTNAPANAHYTGPGTPDDMVSGGKKDYNDCPWECDDGYGRHGDTCEALCTAGATMLHVGVYTFNLYPDEACARPAVHIGLPGGTCCAHLEKGEVSGAMHVRYNDTVYHTTN